MKSFRKFMLELGFYCDEKNWSLENYNNLIALGNEMLLAEQKGEITCEELIALLRVREFIKMAMVGGGVLKGQTRMPKSKSISIWEEKWR